MNQKEKEKDIYDDFRLVSMVYTKYFSVVRIEYNLRGFEMQSCYNIGKFNNVLSC